MIKFSLPYFLLTILLLSIEIAIALFVHDRIVRPYVGDFLVVILIYCFIRSFLNIPIITAALFTLAFSFSVELLQYFNIVEKLGLEKSRIAKVVIGSSFEWIDLLAYSLGIVAVISIEKFRARRADSGF